MHKRISVPSIWREASPLSSNVISKPHLRHLGKMQKDQKCSVPRRGRTQPIERWAQGCCISGNVQCRWTKGTVTLECLYTAALWATVWFPKLLYWFINGRCDLNHSSLITQATCSQSKGHKLFTAPFTPVHIQNASFQNTLLFFRVIHCSFPGFCALDSSHPGYLNI